MKILTVRRRWENLAVRHPRLTYFVGSAGTRSAIPLLLWASAVAEVSSGMLSRQFLWFLAALLTLIASWRLVIAGYHAAACPCVLETVEDEDLAFSPVDAEEC